MPSSMIPLSIQFHRGSDPVLLYRDVVTLNESNFISILRLARWKVGHALLSGEWLLRESRLVSSDGSLNQNRHNNIQYYFQVRGNEAL